MLRDEPTNEFQSANETSQLFEILLGGISRSVPRDFYDRAWSALGGDSASADRLLGFDLQIMELSNLPELPELPRERLALLLKEIVEKSRWIPFWYYWTDPLVLQSRREAVVEKHRKRLSAAGEGKGRRVPSQWHWVSVHEGDQLSKTQELTV
jgi:hypothetical protein